MVDALISATVKVVLETVISNAAGRIGMVLGVKKELEELSKTAAMIQGLLANADGKMHDPGVRVWLKQLEDEVLKADTVLDELNYDNLRREVKYRNQSIRKKVCCFFSFFNAIGFSSKLASKIRDINNNLEKIRGRANELGLVVKYQIEAALRVDAAGATTSRQTDYIIVPNVVGRADDESKIVEMLLSPSERVVSVIPITGPGGLGKTTLAKSVYNNPKFNEHFGKKIWVCLAKEIQILELFKLILVQLMQEEVNVKDRNVIVTRIGEKLNGQRFFLVLDDVWNHEQGLWNDFFNTLEGLNATKGSWCILTTRLQPVAKAMPRHLQMNDGPYFLRKLSDGACWSFLKTLVVGEEEVPKELEAIREQILRRCSGLPLAVRLIGGLLHNNGKEKWHSIVKESLLNEYQSEINQILNVSFDHLSPASVKECFAYCSIFPQDMELEEDLLIQLWIAEGFVLSDRKKERVPEEIGSEYLKTLLQNSLLEKVESWQKTCYKMHDLVHDFAKSILNLQSSNQDRYLALSSSEGMTENTIMTIPASIRTLFLHLESGIPADMFLRFKYLHVLKLSGYDVKFLPSSIGNLLHLRLLDISSSGITSLPESLCKLYNLQTLTMDFGKHEGGLPERMSNLISLRHLNYYNCVAEFKMPTQLGRLTCLQTLKFFNVSQEKGCGIEELGTLKYLKGSLEIRNLGLIKCKEAAREAKLFEKPNLSCLDFIWMGEHRQSDNCADEDVLEGLQPHQNLQELAIHYFMGNKFPQWLINLSKLVVLRIQDCHRCSELPALGQLPSLKCLSLVRLVNIRFIGDEFYGITKEDEEEGRSRGSGRSTRRRKFFPTLESLRVTDLNNLIEWKDTDQVRSAISEAEVDVFPMLRDFTICYCGNLRGLSKDLFGSSLQRLDISNCPRLISLEGNGQKCPLSCLERLSIIDCDELTSISGKMFQSHTSLTYLSMERCSNLESFSLNLQETPSLETFCLVGCPKLILSLNLQETPSLEVFCLVGCPKLIPHYFKGFAFATRLRYLSICPFFSENSSMDNLDWAGLISSSSLLDLFLIGLPRTDSLPCQIQYLTTLTSLCLEGFGGVEVLPDWIGDLVSLEKLWLQHCEKLRSLPSEDAMRRLTKFTSVCVFNCPLLRQRYTPQRGIYLEEEEEISSDPASNDGPQTSASCCFPSLLKKKSSRES